MLRRNPVGAAAPISLRDRLCNSLEARCADPNVAWPYHPRSGLGSLLINSLIQSLSEVSPEFSRRVTAGDIRLAVGKKLGGKRRQKKFDLTLTRPTHDDQLVAVEAKVCMTAHSKARTRLVAEITSSLDALLDANKSAKFFVLVVVNYGESFTSPLNLPGPNEHETKDAPLFVESLMRGLSDNAEICCTLVVPIEFDNETYCRPRPHMDGQYLPKEQLFISRLLEELKIALREPTKMT
jgi:hypothetical protein